MASDLSTYFGNKIARWLAGNGMPAAPVAVYSALFNGDPKGAGVEVTTNVRAAGRLGITWGALALGTGNVLASSADVDYGNSAGAASVSHVAVFDAASGGNLLASKAVAGGAITITVGSPVRFASGDISFTIGS